MVDMPLRDSLNMAKMGDRANPSARINTNQ